MTVNPTESEQTQSRKADHLRICLEDDVNFRETRTGLEHYRFRHCCLPELDLAEIDLSTSFLGKSLGSPLLISSMTGGTDQAKLINQRLAEVAQAQGLAMGVGSQRVAVENPDLSHTFDVRSQAPDILLFANLGAVQLNYGYGVDQCQRAIAMLEADALILHINPLQEAVQSRGDQNFKGLLDKIQRLCYLIPIPVIAKEVGNGISGEMARRLIDVGVQAIDVAGAGGTSWANVEGKRAQDIRQRRLGALFSDWGLPTADCLVQVRSQAPDIPLIASGGLRNGLDIAKTLALGADLAGLATPFLKAAADSPDTLNQLVELLNSELATVLFCTGNRTIKDLQRSNSLDTLK
jgi:isopentenyl-diphosphate delta-isomerase